MSNDTKFWCLRFLSWALIFLDSWFVLKAAMASLSEEGSVTIWIVLFVITSVISMFVYIWARKAKAERWATVSGKTQAQIEVETLAAYSKQEQEAKEKASPPISPQATAGKKIQQ